MNIIPFVPKSANIFYISNLSEAFNYYKFMPKNTGRSSLSQLYTFLPQGPNGMHSNKVLWSSEIATYL